MEVVISDTLNVSRKTLMFRMQVSSDEIVCWMDCGFYLMPITSSKLSQYGLSWDDIKVVNPLDSECTKLFEESNAEGKEGEEGEEGCMRKQYRKFPCDISPYHSMFPRFFFSEFM